MKKILMFLCCVFAVSGAFAVGDCPSNFIEFKGIQNPGDNEFLYSTVAAHNFAVSGFKKSRSFNLIGGEVYECDNEQGCMNGSLVFLGNDSNYVFKSDIIKHKIMECSVGFEDKWIAHEWTECPDSKIGETYKIKFMNTNSADCHAMGPYDYCCFTGDHKSCLLAQKRGEPANWTQSGTCNCGDKYVWNSETGHCDIKDGDVTPNKKSCDGVAHGKSETKGCPSTMQNADRCRRTCNDGQWSGWTLISCKKGYKVQSGKCVPETNDNGGKQPGDGNNGAGTGGNNGDTGGDVNVVVNPPFNCSLDMFADWRVLYKDCADVLKSLDELELYCVSSEKIEQGYKTRVAKLQELRAACEQRIANQKSRVSQSTTIITGASKSLDDIMGTLKVDVWKTAEGNFNGARLASDSIAGVVLGTAGGLITSHLVKKGQIKNGFEDIQCTVGGQKVADWGDEFTVGIR